VLPNRLLGRRAPGAGRGPARNDGMHPERAELSSLANVLADVIERITAAAERSDERKDEQVANDLFAVERALIGAQRRLNGTVDKLI
jgi:hypothetical protein